MSLANYTPEQLAVLPAATPPQGIISNLENPQWEGPKLIFAGAFLMTLMYIFAAVRFYMKIFVRKKVTADDWTTLIAVIGTTGYYIICVCAVTIGKYATHMWDVSAAHAMSRKFLIIGFMTNWPTGLIWAFAKTSFFLMYLQLFTPLRWIQWTCGIGLFLNWGFYSGVIAATIYFSAPHVGETWVEASMSSRQQRTLDMTLPIASGSLFLDIYILVIPIIATSGLRLRTEQKWRVLVVFGTGIMACVASTLAIVYKTHLNAHTNDWTYWVYPTMLISLVEMCVGITCSCMPSTAGFLKRMTGGESFVTWSIRVLSLSRTRTGSGKSEPSSSSSGDRSSKSPEFRYPTRIKAKTYINIETETSSTYELTSVRSQVDREAAQV